MGGNKTKLNKNILHQLEGRTHRKEKTKDKKKKTRINWNFFLSGSPAEIKAMCVSFD
jgi:hypothetical protein